jgi:hypothetical protein
VIVGEDVAGGTDDDATAQALLGLVALVAEKEAEPRVTAARVPSAALLVLMLTTAGDARLAAGLKLPAATVPDPPDGASMTDTAPLSVGRLFSHSGFMTPTTKYAASSTVTD